MIGILGHFQDFIHSLLLNAVRHYSAVWTRPIGMFGACSAEAIYQLVAYRIAILESCIT